MDCNVGVMVGEPMSRVSAWEDTINKLRSRLSKWKVKTLSIGGRLTLLKSVLGASPLYYMSIYKAPIGVLKEMEAIRRNFFNGVDSMERKMTWIAWQKVLASKKHGGLGVSSFFALNRALLLKWVWRFISHDDSLWSKVIQAIYGACFDLHSSNQTSPWCAILREVQLLKAKGFDFISHCKKRVGNGLSTMFWLENWNSDVPFCKRFPRVFALDLDKDVSVASKLGSSIDVSFRRGVRDGVERQQWDDLQTSVQAVSLSHSVDRWLCDLTGDGEFRVKEVRNAIDDMFLPSHCEPTRWIKCIPIKINIFVWRARRDCLPTRQNLIRRGVSLESDACPLCADSMETSQHIFFQCCIAQDVFRSICRWWDLDGQSLSSFSDWQTWMLSIRRPSASKVLLEGVFYVAWWYIWMFRNRSVFDQSPPRRSVMFDDIVSFSFNWCSSRSKSMFSWENWLKNPHLIIL